MAGTIQTEMELYMKREGLTVTRLAERVGINAGTVSNILNGHRSISIAHLDRMTEVMGLEAGTYYEMFLEEYLAASSLDWRRIGPFFERCAELGKLELMQQAARSVMDNLSYAGPLFEMAEQWFHEEKWPAAAILYQAVAESEKYQHSERLAVCQYRLFKIKLGDNQELNAQAAFRFELYVDRLDEIEQLDALKELIDIYASLHRYDRVEQLSVILGEQAERQFKLREKTLADHPGFREPSMALVGYIFYSYLMRGLVCEVKGDFKQALNFALLYNKPGWALGTDDMRAAAALEKFHFWSVANQYLYKMMGGNKEYIGKYLNHVAEVKEEVIPSLFQVVMIANKYNWDIDALLERFNEEIINAIRNGPEVDYNEQVINNEFAFFLADLAVYHFKRMRYKIGIEWLFKSFNYSLRIHNDVAIIRCISLFESNRHFASEDQLDQYKNYLDEVNKQNEEKLVSYGRIV